MKSSAIPAITLAVMGIATSSATIVETHGYDRSGRLVCTEYADGGTASTDDAAGYSYDASDSGKNPHNYPHINYTTETGIKGTIRILK